MSAPDDSRSRSRRINTVEAGSRVSARFVRWLSALLALGLAARVLVVLWIPTRPVSDFLEYFLRANRLADLGVYHFASGTPDAAHPPAYPLLLALGFELLPGVDRLLAAKLVNCLLGALTVALAAGLARRIGGERAGLLAAGLAAFYPRYLLMPCLIASENLFAPLLLAFLAIAVASCRRHGVVGTALAAGCVIGVLALTRTVAYAMGLVWLAGALASGRRGRPILAGLALIIAAQHAVMLPWAIRNARETGRFAFTSSIGGIGLFIGNNSNATGDWYPWQRDLERARPGVSSQSPWELDETARDAALDWIRKNPVRAAKLYLEKLRRIAVEDTIVAGWAIFAEKVSPPEPGIPVLPGPHPLKAHRRVVLWTLRIAAALLALFGAGGLLFLLRRGFQSPPGPDRAIAVWFFAAAAYVPLVSALIAVNGRYRWPVEDVLVPLAALFLARQATMNALANHRVPPPTTRNEGPPSSR